MIATPTPDMPDELFVDADEYAHDGYAERALADIEKFVGDLCYTVWEKCHKPTHADGNTDWFNDTLPTVDEGKRVILKKIKSLQTRTPPAPVDTINIKREVLQGVRERLDKAARQFRFYQSEHLSRGIPEKATTNGNYGEICEVALASLDAVLSEGE